MRCLSEWARDCSKYYLYNRLLLWRTQANHVEMLVSCYNAIKSLLKLHTQFIKNLLKRLTDNFLRQNIENI